MKRSEEEKTIYKKNARELGQLIRKIRMSPGDYGLGLRRLASAADISPSNMKYIEEGIVTPTPPVYTKIIKTLSPTDKELFELDHLYSLVKGTPPPDVCAILNKNEKLNNILRLLEDVELNENQLSKLKKSIISCLK